MYASFKLLIKCCCYFTRPSSLKIGSLAPARASRYCLAITVCVIILWSFTLVVYDYLAQYYSWSKLQISCYQYRRFTRRDACAIIWTNVYKTYSFLLVMEGFSNTGITLAKSMPSFLRVLLVSILRLAHMLKLCGESNRVCDWLTLAPCWLLWLLRRHLRLTSFRCEHSEDGSGSW